MYGPGQWKLGDQTCVAHCDQLDYSVKISRGNLQRWGEQRLLSGPFKISQCRKIWDAIVMWVCCSQGHGFTHQPSHCCTGSITFWLNSWTQNIWRKMSRRYSSAAQPLNKNGMCRLTGTGRTRWLCFSSTRQDARDSLGPSTSSQIISPPSGSLWNRLCSSSVWGIDAQNKLPWFTNVFHPDLLKPLK